MADLEDIRIKFTSEDDDLVRSAQVLRSLTKEEQNLVAQMRAVNAEAAKTGPALSKAGTDGATGAAKAKAGFASARQELNAVGQVANRLGSAVAGAFAVESLLRWGQEVINIRAQFQKLEAVLTTALGSKSDAQVAFAQIQEFAAKTNFGVLELTDSYVKLVNQGFKPTTKELENLADLANSTGKGFDQLTEAIIDSQTLEFERLKEFGIRAEKDGDKVRFTFKGITTEVNGTSDAIRKYIVGLGDIEGVSGSTAAISETLGGKISNLGDTFDSLFNTIGTRGESVIGNFIGFVNQGIQALNRLIQSEEQRREGGVLKELAKQAEETRERVEALTASNIRLGQQENEARRNALEQITDETEELLEVRARELEQLKQKAKDTADSDEFDKLRDQVQAAEDGLRVDQERLKALKSLNVEYFRPIEPVKLTKEQLAKQTQELEKQKKLLEDMRKAYQGTLEGIERSNPLMDLVRDFEEAAATISRNGVLLGYSPEQIAADLATIEAFYEGRFRAAQDSKDAIARLGEDEVARLRDLLEELNQTYTRALLENDEALAKFVEAEIFYTEKAYDRALAGRLERFASAGDKGIDLVKQQAEREIEANEEKNKRIEEQEAEHRRKVEAIVQESIQFVGDLFNAGFEIGASRRDAELQGIAQQKEAELKLVGDNEQAKDFINNQFAAKQKQIKTRQAQADKAQALFNIGINTAAAVVKAVMESPKTFGLPFSAFALATGIAQAAVVASRPLPKFRHGVLDLKGPGSETSDSIHAMLSRGESVMTAKETKLFMPTLKAIRAKTIDPELLNSVVRMDYQAIAPAARQPDALNGEVVGLREEVKGLRGDLRRLPVSTIQMDEKGFKKYISTGDSTTQILNNQFPI